MRLIVQLVKFAFRLLAIFYNKYTWILLILLILWGCPVVAWLNRWTAFYALYGFVLYVASAK